MRILALLVIFGVGLAGCATPDADPAGNNDPYETTNRAIFDFNLRVDRTFLRPTAERYQTYVPETVRDSLRSVLDNLRSPVIFANDVLQGEVNRAGDTAGRFMVNSTIGLGGLIDVAAAHGASAHDEDFGQTLAVWGAGDGPYIMLPLLGPSNPRDVVGKTADYAMDPTHHIRIKRHLLWLGVREYLNVIDTRTRSLEALDGIERDSLDYYAAVRSLYHQNRMFQIRNGMPETDE